MSENIVPILCKSCAAGINPPIQSRTCVFYKTPATNLEGNDSCHDFMMTKEAQAKFVAWQKIIEAENVIDKNNPVRTDFNDESELD